MRTWGEQKGNRRRFSNAKIRNITEEGCERN